MRHTSSLLSLPGPLWLGVVAPDRVLSMGQIELNCELMLNRIVWDKTVLLLTVCKQMSDVQLTVCKQKLHTEAKLNCLK